MGTVSQPTWLRWPKVERTRRAIALEWLGQPACALGNGVYRWALDNGLALDVTVTEGEVTRSELNR
jgi:hypothetical protein